MRRITTAALLLLSLPAAAGSLEKIGHLQLERAGHTATLLHDGRVLVAGDDPARTMELIDVVYGVATSTVTQARTTRDIRDHTATLLPSGEVLLIGGEQHRPMGDRDVSAYRPDTLTLVAQLQDARTRHEATLLADGRVLVTAGERAPAEGGSSETLASVEIVSADGSVRGLSPMGQQRSEHTATRLNDGRVLIVGGTRYLPGMTEIFDPATETFAYGPATRYRSTHTATLLQDGRVLIAGGGLNVEDYAEIFDPISNQFTATALLFSHDRHTATLMADGSVLLAGGGEVVLYDPRRDVVVERLSLGQDQHGHDYMFDGGAAALLPDGSVLLLGGLVNAHWQYAASDIWRYKRSPMPKRRAVR